MAQTIRVRTNPGHVRDAGRGADQLQICCCGHVTRTIDEMRAHIANPEAESRPGAPVVNAWFGRSLMLQR